MRISDWSSDVCSSDLKVGSIFTSSGTQHGGQESTILGSIPVLLHHGMIIVGLPYTAQGQMRLDEITGGSPYGASTIAAPDRSRQPSTNELELASLQGKFVADVARKDRKSVVEGKSVSVRVDLGGRRIIKK